jgi:hypothetical protein
MLSVFLETKIKPINSQNYYTIHEYYTALTDVDRLKFDNGIFKDAEGVGHSLVF